MNQDLEEFAKLWRQEPADEEARIFRRLARRAGRKGRVLRHAEFLLGLFLAAGATAFLIWKPAPATLVVVALIVTGVLWSSWKRSRFAETEMMLDRSSREALIASAVKSARTRLRCSTLGLFLLLPGWMLGIAFKGMLLLDGNVRHFLGSLSESFTHWPGMASAAVVAAIFAFLANRNLRLRRELRRLELVGAQYRREALLEREE